MLTEGKGVSCKGFRITRTYCTAVSWCGAQCVLLYCRVLLCSSVSASVQMCHYYCVCMKIHPGLVRCTFLCSFEYFTSYCFCVVDYFQQEQSGAVLVFHT